MRYRFACIHPAEVVEPQLLVCGSPKALGSWNVNSAIAMVCTPSFSSRELSFWQTTIEIDDGQDEGHCSLERQRSDEEHKKDVPVAFFYKYVCRYRDGTVVWEGKDERDNRSYHRQRSDLVDGVFYLPAAFWNNAATTPSPGVGSGSGSGCCAASALAGVNWHQLSMSMLYRNICSEQSINFSKASEKIYFGSCPRKFYHVAVLKSLGITTVLTLQTEADLVEHCSSLVNAHCFEHDLVYRLKCLYQHQGISFVWLPVKDMDTKHRILMLPQAVIVLTSLLTAGHRVYVCCNAGIGRSAACVAAYMMCVEKMTFRQTEHFMYSRRPVVYVDELALKATYGVYEALFDHHQLSCVAAVASNSGPTTNRS